MTDRPSTRPPGWAEALLRCLLKPEDRESVSGDLLEKYRESIRPSRGERAADAWYVLQVGGFLWRATWFGALVFSAAALARTAYDWLVPTTDFFARAQAPTFFGVSTLLVVGFWSSWRSGSFAAGPLVTAVTSQIAALMSVAGAAVLIAVWHDSDTMRAIAGSGGLGEVFVLPFMMIVPAVIVGGVGAAAAILGKRLLRAA
jgi:hypothetical protein